MGVSATGLAGGLLGFVAFFLPRLWIGVAYLKGEGQATDESVWTFWEFAAVSFVYLPAIAAALAVPPVARWAILLGVASVTQLLAFQVTSGLGTDISTPVLALPATVLLVIGAATSFRRWREGVEGAR